ncbi:unnamed protein product [Ixodes persulcatus]
MLLHYAGEDVNDIFESLCDTTVAAAPSTSSSPSTATASIPASAANEFERAIEALTLHFQPRCNVEQERFLFAKRGSLRMRASPPSTRVDMTSLADADSLTSTVRLSHKSSTSSSLRRKALSKLTLTQLLDYAHSSELGNFHTKGIEKDQVGSSVALYAKDTAPRTKSHEQKSSDTNNVCGHCGGPYPHPTHYPTLPS